MTYAFELHVARTVERCSDGQATLLLEFGELRGLKIVAAEPPPPIRHAPTDRPLLARLGRLRPEDGIVIVEPSHAAEILFGAQGAAVGRHALTRALAAEDSLSGKRVRATWADHEGIVAIQPLDGHLTGAELATVLQVAVPLESVVLSPAAPPAGWTADARLAALLFSPAEWQVAGGTMSFSLQPTRAGIAEPGPMIVCCGGELALESTVVPRDVGQLAAEGTIQYDPITAVIASASFRGPCRIPQPWNDGLLVQWHYRDSPVLEVFYHCRVRETTATGAS